MAECATLRDRRSHLNRAPRLSAGGFKRDRDRERGCVLPSVLKNCTAPNADSAT